VAGLIRWIFVWKFIPLRTRAAYPKYAIQNLPLILSRPTSFTWRTLGCWKDLLNNLPLLVTYIHGICKKWLTDAHQFTNSLLAFYGHFHIFEMASSILVMRIVILNTDNKKIKPSNDCFMF
jgi:hypothetical protein